MKAWLKGIKENYIVSALLSIGMGILLIVYPADATRIFCLTIGGLIFLFGLVKFASFFFLDDIRGTVYGKFNLLTGIVLLVVGAWIFLFPEGVIALLPMILGILIAFDGVNDLVRSLRLIRRYDKWWLTALLSLVTTGVGAYLILRPFSSVNLMVRVIGVLLIVEGVLDFWTMNRVSRLIDAVEDGEALVVESRDIDE